MPERLSPGLHGAGIPQRLKSPTYGSGIGRNKDGPVIPEARPENKERLQRLKKALNLPLPASPPATNLNPLPVSGVTLGENS